MKKRITALTLAAVMVIGTVAVAASAEKNITVTPMALNVNGQTVTPTKSDGTPAEVFAYEGATYAPLRYLTELNGNQVVWDANDPGTAKIATGSLTYSDTIAWDGQYDVVVVGFGGAGAVAARTAADEGAKVLLTEKAPEGHEGGNTRYAGQLFVNGHGDEEATRAYYDALKGDHEVPEDMYELYTKEIAHLEDTWVNEYGVDKADFVNWSGTRLGNMSPEYPEFPGSDKISLDTLHDGYSDSYMWQVLRKQVTDRADKIDVWFESPATKLIQDPITKAILGVTIERDGQKVNIKAVNGVVLATGGFENDPEMVETYLGMTDSRAIGTLYNTGDGIKMAEEVGADLWHMHVYESLGYCGGLSIKTPEGIRATNAQTVINSTLWLGSSVLVGADGNRFLREDEYSRHGHLYHTGSWENPLRSTRNFVVYDKAQAKKIADAGIIAEEYQSQIIEASSLKELAKATGMDADILAATIKDFNAAAKSGNDVKFGRSKDSMTAFASSGPYYALELVPAILNTQGGPRRNVNAEVLDHDGNPIPHLYSAGELGGICSFQYQGGGNLAECVIFGKVAGKNAATPKTDVVSAPLVAAADNIRFTPGKTSDIGGSVDIATTANEYVGVSHNGMGGDVYVKVTVTDGKIAKVEVVEQHETVGIGDKAIEALPDAIVKAGSADVDGVSGATITSNAIKEAVKDALAQVK